MLNKYILELEKQCENFFEIDDNLHALVKLIQEGKFELDNLKKKEKENSKNESLKVKKVTRKPKKEKLKSQAETETINFSFLNLQNCIDDHIYQLKNDLEAEEEYLSSPQKKHILLLESQLIDEIIQLQEGKRENEKNRLELLLQFHLNQEELKSEKSIYNLIQKILERGNLPIQDEYTLKIYQRNLQQNSIQLEKERIIRRLPIIPALKQENLLKYHIYAMIFAFNEQALPFDLSDERIQYILNVKDKNTVPKLMKEIEQENQILSRQIFDDKGKVKKREILCFHIIDEFLHQSYYSNSTFYVPFIQDNLDKYNLTYLENLLLSIIIEYQAINHPLIVPKDWFRNFTNVSLRAIQKSLKNLKKDSGNDFITEVEQPGFTNLFKLTKNGIEIFKKYL